VVRTLNTEILNFLSVSDLIKLANGLKVAPKHGQEVQGETNKVDRTKRTHTTDRQ
jgi:hypothetical protein